MTNKQLQEWYDNLPFEDRFKVQRLLVKLYIMESENAKN